MAAAGLQHTKLSTLPLPSSLALVSAGPASTLPCGADCTKTMSQIGVGWGGSLTRGRFGNPVAKWPFSAKRALTAPWLG